jgi:hypothetical protein
MSWQQNKNDVLPSTGHVTSLEEVYIWALLGEMSGYDCVLFTFDV